MGLEIAERIGTLSVMDLCQISARLVPESAAWLCVSVCLFGRRKWIGKLTCGEVEIAPRPPPTPTPHPPHVTPNTLPQGCLRPVSQEWLREWLRFMAALNHCSYHSSWLTSGFVVLWPKNPPSAFSNNRV